MPATEDIWSLTDEYVERHAQLDPLGSTMTGIVGHDAEVTDYSPDGIDARAEHDRATVVAARSLQPADQPERVARDFLVERLEAELAVVDTGEYLRPLRVMFSPFQQPRQVFDVMPRQSADDWETIAVRLEKVPIAVDGLRASLTAGMRTGVLTARRQALACANQAATFAGETGTRSFFDGLVEKYQGRDDALRARLQRYADSASAAYASLGHWLSKEYAPAAPEQDAVGAERYGRWVRLWLGSELDLNETYRWGWEELYRIEAEMDATADRIIPGATVPEVIAVLERDPDRAIHGEDNLRAFLQDLMDSTIAALDGVHFDIPEPIKRVEAMIAPPGSAAAMYYTGPSEDLSRPGRTWYPTLGKTEFPVWGEVSTCYHEGVPGHHLQLGQVRFLRDQLTRYQRTAFCAGHGEGWALYAERLMDELGYLENPEYRLGYLAAQVMRAIRIVVDIGMHLALRLPDGERFHPGEVWTPGLGLAFAQERSCHPPEVMASEVDRYLGWPAQAISYKVGERVWLAGRVAAKQRHGSTFDLKAFHRFALDLGPLGLEQFERELAHY
jgi:uncharacterized protein (DUF885 family)